MKFWLCPEKTQKQTLYKTFLQGCKANPTFSYRLYFEGEKLEEEKQLKEYDILDDSLIVMEFKENNQ